MARGLVVNSPRFTRNTNICEQHWLEELLHLHAAAVFMQTLNLQATHARLIWSMPACRRLVPRQTAQRSATEREATSQGRNLACLRDICRTLAAPTFMQTARHVPVYEYLLQAPLVTPTKAVAGHPLSAAGNVTFCMLSKGNMHTRRWSVADDDNSSAHGRQG